MLERIGETGTLLHCWWECKLVQPLWKTVWRFLKILKIEPPYDIAITLLGIYPRDTEVLMHRATWTPMFTAALSTIAKLWKEPKCSSTDEWIKKMWFIRTIEYYLAMRKNEILPFATTWMELEGIPSSISLNGNSIPPALSPKHMLNCSFSHRPKPNS